MKKSNKKIVIAMSAMLLVGAPATYAASAQVVKGTVLAYNYIVNNVTSTGSASNSKPIVVNGKTYLPVDMVKEGTKVNVTVDSKSKTVRFGEKNGKTPFKSLISSYDDYEITKKKAYTKIGESTFDEVLVSNDRISRMISLQLKKGYQTLHLEIAALPYDKSQERKSVSFKVKNMDNFKEIYSFSVNVDDRIQSFDIDVANVNDLYITSSSQSPTSVILPTSYFK
ncbi:stalk domain-containing protein [Saccharibacillus sp. JS10]|uniref:stalk domain-containing protein n=1 Tax=Saccharibacillus sp. JS10 TaxID=2950552 RepID=UPI00210EBD74|nr:stalk domain-containing protein [Saccharibacillus sp. JS10]MCQ4085622.1 copper amine oxidase N-terminal domain-containing protein [Saccharibacillus sp. JS10]